MKTAMQEAIKEIAELWGSPSDRPTYSQIFKVLEDKLEKEKEQIKPLIDALEDIKNWDDDLEVEWGDCGERAIAALKIFKEKK